MSERTIYFAYGSNLWLDQMKKRCPEHEYIGIGILKDWHWIINDRGYANVVPSQGDLVYGMLYTLNETDEKTLDEYEGVPTDYKKDILPIEYLGKHEDGGEDNSRTIHSLVYVDDLRKVQSQPKAEYIIRMNKAIHDAIKEGIPTDYVERSLRPYIPVVE